MNQDPNNFALRGGQASSSFGPPLQPLSGQPLGPSSSGSYPPQLPNKRNNTNVAIENSPPLNNSHPPRAAALPPNPSGRSPLYRIPDSGPDYTNPSPSNEPGPASLRPRSSALSQPQPGPPTDPSLPAAETVYVNRSMLVRALIAYLILALEIFFEAFAGTHIGGTQSASGRTVIIAATSGIQLGIHLILLIAFVSAFQETLYLRLAMYDLFLREFKWFFLSWGMSVLVVGGIRGYRVYNTLGAAAVANIYDEWSKPGFYAVFIIERVFQLLYFAATAASLQLGMHQRLYTRECLDKLASKLG